MYPMLEHPDISSALRTGYPSHIQEDDREEYDEDALVDERREDYWDD